MEEVWLATAVGGSPSALEVHFHGFHHWPPGVKWVYADLGRGGSADEDGPFCPDGYGGKVAGQGSGHDLCAGDMAPSWVAIGYCVRPRVGVYFWFLERVDGASGGGPELVYRVSPSDGWPDGTSQP